MQNTINFVRTSMRKAFDHQGQMLYDEREINAVVDLLLEEVCGISRMERIMHPHRELTATDVAAMQRIAGLLQQGVPVQQALGYEWFCGARFLVTPDVLIPRPETAELVHWIVESYSSLPRPVTILDVGTGSGCIAISLARLINNSQVLGLDLSTAALDVARRNACQQCVDNVQFIRYDILTAVDNSSAQMSYSQLSTTYTPVDKQDCQPELSTVCQQFDVIVSNPPYICQREAEAMSDIVLQNEPVMALFVPDSDPLLFYRAIAQYALTHLSRQGQLFFEINAAYGDATCQLLTDLGYRRVELRKDVNGRDRMIRAQIDCQ